MLFPANMMVRRRPAAGGGGFANTKSLELNSTTKSYTRTQGAGASQKKMTFSFWIKSDANTENLDIAAAGGIDGIIAAAGSNFGIFLNGASDGFVFTSVTLGVGSWDHCLIQIDTDNATDSQRVRMWLNGTEDTGLTFVVGVTSGYTTMWGATGQTEEILKSESDSVTSLVDEVAKIDNQLLNPSSFRTGTAPIDLTPLTFGAQGYWIRLETGAAATGGNDSSGNGNNFANNNYIDGDFKTDVAA